MLIYTGQQKKAARLGSPPDWQLRDPPYLAVMTLSNRAAVFHLTLFGN
jgi:hypothetical protein